MTQGKHFAAGGDHFAALPNKKIHTPKGIARLTVTAATMAAMTGSSLISPFTAFAQTGDRAGLIGETFIIGGTVLVAAGVFLDQKKRREQM